MIFFRAMESGGGLSDWGTKARTGWARYPRGSQKKDAHFSNIQNSPPELMIHGKKGEKKCKISTFNSLTIVWLFSGNPACQKLKGTASLKLTTLKLIFTASHFQTPFFIIFFFLKFLLFVLESASEQSEFL